MENLSSKKKKKKTHHPFMPGGFCLDTTTLNSTFDRIMESPANNRLMIAHATRPSDEAGGRMGTGRKPRRETLLAETLYTAERQVIHMQISLDKLAGGAAAEKLNIELRKLASNVLDPNTKAEATRTVTLTVTVKPNKQRQVGDAEISVKSSLAPSAGIPTSFMFDYDTDGTPVLAEMMSRDPNQTQLADNGSVTDGAGKPIEGNSKVVGLYR